MLDVAEPIMRQMNAKRVKNPVFIVMRIIMQDTRFVKKVKKKKFSIFKKWNGYHVVRRLIELRFGHTYMTHGYLMDDNSLGQLPVCEWCGAALLTVHHIVVECQGLQRGRSRMMATTKQRDWNMENLLSDGGKIHVVLEFLRMTNIFDHV